MMMICVFVGRDWFLSNNIQCKGLFVDAFSMCVMLKFSRAVKHSIVKFRWSSSAKSIKT